MRSAMVSAAGFNPLNSGATHSTAGRPMFPIVNRDRVSIPSIAGQRIRRERGPATRQTRR